MYIPMDSGHSKMSCASSVTGMLLNKPFLGTVLKKIDLVSFFFPLYGSLRHCLHYLNTEASKRVKTAKEMAFLVPAPGFAFEGHLSN